MAVRDDRRAMLERVLEMEDAMMYQRKLDEGARVVIGSDKTLHATEKGR